MNLKNILIASLLVLISLPNFAQEAKAEKQLEKAIELTQKSDKIMKEGLQLTEKQIPLVSEINLDFSKKMVALFAKPGSKFGKIGDMKKNVKDRDAKLKKVLTADQMELFEDKVSSKVKKEMRKTVNKDS
jgi:hypothetical protein